MGYPLKQLKGCSFPNGVTVQNCSLLKIVFRLLTSQMGYGKCDLLIVADTAGAARSSKALQSWSTRIADLAESVSILSCSAIDRQWESLFKVAKAGPPYLRTPKTLARFQR